MNRIKTAIILTTILFSGVFLTSCNSDDDYDQPSPIIGIWKSISETTEEFKNNASAMSSITVDDNNFIRYTFNADKTFTMFITNIYMEATDSFTSTGTYKTKGNKLFVTYPGNTTYMIDFALNNDQLVLVETEDNPINNKGIEKFITTITYSKQ